MGDADTATDHETTVDGEAVVDGRSGDEGDPPADDVADAPWWKPTGDRLALWLFVAFVVVAAPLLLFHYGDYFWFFRDDLEFLSQRKPGHWPPLLEPHGGAHPSVLPRLVFFGLWELFGMRRYIPYQACVVALHLTASLLIRWTMRRAGVNAWLASAAAAIFVLYGPGSQNILWAFQVGFTGSLVYGFAHLLIADHDGPIGRRDALALGFGLLAVASSGVGVATTIAVGAAVLIRRGWKPALLHTVPLGLLVGVWAKVYDAGELPGTIHPSPRRLLSWVGAGYVDMFEAIGHFDAVAVLLFLVLVAGVALAVLEARGSWTDLRAWGVPVGLALGGLVFTMMTAWGRAGTQPLEQAGSERYMHIMTATALPLLAMAAQSLLKRLPSAVPTLPAPAVGVALVALFLLPVPFNTEAFTPRYFGRHYMTERARILSTAPRMPFAEQVSPDAEPIPDPYMGHVTMRYLLGAMRAGKLPRSTAPITARTENEFRVRLGIQPLPETVDEADRDTCRAVPPGGIRVAPRKGSVVTIDGPVQFATVADGKVTGPWITYDANAYFGSSLRVELPGLHLRAARVKGAPVQLCTAN